MIKLVKTVIKLMKTAIKLVKTVMKLMKMMIKPMKSGKLPDRSAADVRSEKGGIIVLQAGSLLPQWQP